MVPPEFEGIEQIDQLGRPEFSEEGMPEGMREEIDSQRGESEGQRREFGEMPGEFDDQRGESADQPNFRGESAPDEQSGSEAAL